MERRGVEMIREEKRPDEVDPVPSTSSRDARSVFPTASKAAASAAAAALFETIAGAGGGADRFVSEAEALRVSERRLPGSEVGDPDKPLLQVLRETAAAKEAAREQRERELRIGKNRPLDPEEVAFFESVDAERAERERRAKREEEEAMLAFRNAQKGGGGGEAEEKGVRGPGAVAGPHLPGGGAEAGAGEPDGKQSTASRPSSASASVVPVSAPPRSAFGAGSGFGRLRRARGARPAAKRPAEEAEASVAKRERAGEAPEGAGPEPEEGGAVGLGSLLGGYGSSSDESDG